MFYVIPHGKDLKDSVTRSESYLQAKHWADRESKSRKMHFDIVEIRTVYTTDEIEQLYQELKGLEDDR